MEIGDIFLASKRSEQDTLRCNAIEISLYLLASERSERAQSCSCSIEISDTCVYIYVAVRQPIRACSVVRNVAGV